MGRLSLALYAILIVNVMGGFLDVVKQYLMEFCKITATQQTTTATTTSSSKESKQEGAKQQEDKKEK